MKTILKTPAQASETRHAEGVQFRCHDCSEVKPVQTNGGTGYAVCDEGKHLVCYACADKRETADMLTSDRFTAYVSPDGRSITTWTGGKLGTVSFGGRHPWSRERHYITARDVHGQHWHGTGAQGMYCNLRKCKA